MEDRNEVIFSGPHTLNNRPIILKTWEPNFDFSEEVLSTIPLWVKFPNLPLNCWFMESLSRICSVMRNPIYADECTSKIERISFARVLIEMDVTKPLPRIIKVHDLDGKVFEQEIWYDWQPQYCNKCLQIGHMWSVELPPKKPAQQPRGYPKKQMHEW